MTDSTKTTRSVPYLVHQGFAAEDIKPNSISLEIICPELIPNATVGTVGAGITSGVSTLKDRDGKTISTATTTANHIVATWEGASNSRYPPLIRKGEPVELFKVANQDKYFWRTSGSGRDFRKTDRIQIEVGASDPNKPSGEKDDTNTYSAYLDSHNKKVGLRTSQANGEAVAFSMEADLEQGIFYISDNSEAPGNRIFLDTGKVSGVPTFQVNLTSGIALKFEKDNGFIKIPKKFEIDAGERIVFNAPITVFNINKAGTFIINAANVTIGAAKSFIVESTVVGLNTASVKISGIVIAAAGRIMNLVKGAAGGSYSGASVQRPQESPVSTPSNSPDTDASGPPYKT